MKLTRCRMRSPRKNEETWRKIDSDKWGRICNYIKGWMVYSNGEINMDSFYKHFPLWGVPAKEIYAVMMFMTTEQIVIFDKSWKCLIVTYKNDEPVGFKLVPRLEVVK